MKLKPLGEAAPYGIQLRAPNVPLRFGSGSGSHKLFPAVLPHLADDRLEEHMPSCSKPTDPICLSFVWCAAASHDSEPMALALYLCPERHGNATRSFANVTRINCVEQCKAAQHTKWLPAWSERSCNLPRADRQLDPRPALACTKRACAKRL